MPSVMEGGISAPFMPQVFGRRSAHGEPRVTVSRRSTSGMSVGSSLLYTADGQALDVLCFLLTPGAKIVMV